MSRKKKAVMFTTDNEHLSGQLNAGFSKVCKIFKVYGIESLKYVREFYTTVGEIWRHAVVPRRERGERKKQNLGPVPGHTAARSSTS